MDVLFDHTLVDPKVGGLDEALEERLVELLALLVALIEELVAKLSEQIDGLRVDLGVGPEVSRRDPHRVGEHVEHGLDELRVCNVLLRHDVQPLVDQAGNVAILAQNHLQQRQ